LHHSPHLEGYFSTSCHRASSPSSRRLARAGSRPGSAGAGSSPRTRSKITPRRNFPELIRDWPIRSDSAPFRYHGSSKDAHQYSARIAASSPSMLVYICHYLKMPSQHTLMTLIPLSAMRSVSISGSAGGENYSQTTSSIGLKPFSEDISDSTLLTGILFPDTYTC
jgi:hypothetical protein